MLHETVSRRAAVLASFCALCAPPLPGFAATPHVCAARLQEAVQVLDRVDTLLALRPSWPEAAALLRSPTLQESALSKSFDECTQPPTAKENLMDKAAFIVYYEERRYNDLRLEPQTPGRRAVQNGYRTDALRALSDERLEIEYLLKGSDESADDLLGYSAAVRRAMRGFLDTLEAT